MELKIDAARRYGAFYTALEIASEALSALRAEAWHPIEKAAELGAKDGQWVIVMHERWSQASWTWAGWVDYDSRVIPGITHFRFINPPEN